MDLADHAQFLTLIEFPKPSEGQGLGEIVFLIAPAEPCS
jgi:hypothetical protein